MALSAWRYWPTNANSAFMLVPPNLWNQVVQLRWISCRQRPKHEGGLAENLLGPPTHRSGAKSFIFQVKVLGSCHCATVLCERVSKSCTVTYRSTKGLSNSLHFDIRSLQKICMEKWSSSSAVHTFKVYLTAHRPRLIYYRDWPMWHSVTNNSDALVGAASGHWLDA